VDKIRENDVEQTQPGALPLIRTSLNWMWKSAGRERTFTLDGYRESGGLSRRNCQTAEEETFKQLQTRTSNALSADLSACCG